MVRRSPVALDTARGVVGQVAAGDEVVAQAAQRREVGADADLAQLALLHEVALVRLHVLLHEAERARLRGAPPRVVALELVERAPVGADGLGTLLFQVLRHEAVEAALELNDGEAKRLGHGRTGNR